MYASSAGRAASDVGRGEASTLARRIGLLWWVVPPGCPILLVSNCQIYARVGPRRSAAGITPSIADKIDYQATCRPRAALPFTDGRSIDVWAPWWLGVSTEAARRKGLAWAAWLTLTSPRPPDGASAVTASFYRSPATEVGSLIAPLYVSMLGRKG